MAITFNQLAQAILTETTMTVTIVFFPTGIMNDLIYGEIETDTAIKLIADGYRIFTIKVDSSSVDRVELEKTKINIIQEAINEGNIT